jgi:hypothetical protein
MEADRLPDVSIDVKNVVLVAFPMRTTNGCSGIGVSP